MCAPALVPEGRPAHAGGRDPSPIGTGPSPRWRPLRRPDGRGLGPRRRRARAVGPDHRASLRSRSIADPAPSSPSGPVALEAPDHAPRGPPGRRATPIPDRPTTTTAESVLAESRARLEGLGNYQVWLNRQERVGNTLGAPEDVVLSIRREPAAVRLEWPNGPHKRREVLYSAGENGGLMHVNMADSLLPVPRLSLPPDSPLVMHNSRHPITEAGFDTILKNVEDAIKGEKAGDPATGKVTYEGLEKAEQLDRPCHKIVRMTPSGETWAVYIDPESRSARPGPGRGREGGTPGAVRLPQPPLRPPRTGPGGRLRPRRCAGGRPRDSSTAWPRPTAPTTRTPHPHSPDNCQSGAHPGSLCQVRPRCPEDSANPQGSSSIRT